MNIRHLSRVIILTVICGTFLAGCIDYDFSLQLTPYAGTLRTDGYYHRYGDNGQTLTMYLYQNGIILRGYAYHTFDLDSVEFKMVEGYDSLTKRKNAWGIFLVTENELIYEMRSINGVYKCFGIIKNDTTFQITHSMEQGKKFEYEDDIWHFKQFSPKPDSTNRWIQ